MTNTVEFFPRESANLALPATTVTVFVDGALCGDLEPVEIVRSGWPEFAQARLRYNPAADRDADVLTAEQVEDRFGMGRHISLRQIYNPIGPDVATDSLPVFAGQVEGIETTIGPEGETIEIIARDCSAVLERITVYGQAVRRNEGSVTFLPGLAAAFNPSGEGNAASEPVTAEGATYTVFAPNTNGARPWTCAEVIGYLLSRYLPTGSLHWPDLEQLRALTEDRQVRDLDVTGKSLLAALHACCAEVGLQFRFVPRPTATGPDQAIVFYRSGQGRCVELSCQCRGERLNVARTHIAALHGVRNAYPVTHRYLGRGDFKVYEATFDLVPAWDSSLESTNYEQFSASTNPNFYQVRDVYRKWCLNEAGDYTGAPFNQGAAHDFSGVFDGAAYVSRRRRFWPALSADAQGQSFGYHLEVSYDAGAHWWTYLHAFNNLLDECGIWLSSDQLDVDTWVAALKGMLQFRITASVVSDERLTCVVADGPVGSAAPVIDHLLTLPRRFQYRKVTAQSVLAQTNTGGTSATNEADDSAALHDFVRRHAAEPGVIERTDVQTPSLTLHFDPGDRVTSSPDGRDLLSCRRDNRSCVWIERARMDFENQCTNLTVVRQRI